MTTSLKHVAARERVARGRHADRRRHVMTLHRPGAALAITSALCLLGGCGGSLDPATLDPPDRTAPAALGGVVLSVVVDSVSIAVTDSVSLLVSNQADTAVTLTGSSSCRALPELLDASGAAVVPLAGWPCTGDLSPLRLAPGEAYERRLPWTYLAGFAAGGEGIAPGWYWLGAALSAVEVQLQAEYVLVHVLAPIPIVAPNRRQSASR